MPILKPVTASVVAPQQHKQPSRKGKKAWRKNVDVSEIQEGLEDLREEVIKGGVISEKAAADLFTLDTIGDAAIPKRYLKGSKPLRADEIIAQRSAVPAVSIRKRIDERTTDGVIAPKRQRTSYVSHKEMMRLQQIADGKGPQDLVDVVDPTYDPWDEKVDVQEAVQDPQFSFLDKKQKKKAPRTIKHQSISLASHGKPIPAVSKPQGGHSYNPEYADYEARLVEAGEREVAAEEKRQAAAEAERSRRDAAAKSAAEAVAAEDRADLSEWDEDSAWEGFESGVEDVKLNAKRPQRKTQAQRNKIMRRKEEERRAKMAADISRKQEELSRAKQIAKAISARDAGKQVSVFDEGDSTTDDDDQLELRRRKLGKIALPEKQLELVLPDELQESLRLLKPEGNLLKDRYRSLLIRGKMESRRRIAFHKQAKKTVTEKWTHKDFMLH